ncbi:MAG TPA: acyltransferase family protein, partial [Angustibacter sp.]|nr:acyltransferase family protein [Angustibacter sp.]
TTSPAVTGTTRQPWADALRVVAIAGVVVVHAATGYLVDIPWYYDDEKVTSGVWSTVLSFPVFAGGLFWLGPLFLLAGWFSVGSLRRRGPAGFARSRLLRLGAPLVVWVVLLQPLTDWVGNIRSEKGTFAFYLGHTEVSALWFIAALLVFSLAYAGLRTLRRPADPRAVHRTTTLLTAAAATIAVTSFPIWQVWSVLGDMVLNLKVGEWPQAAVLFALGVLAGETQWLQRLRRPTVRRVGWVAVGGAAAAVPLVAYGVSQADESSDLLSAPDWPTATFAVLDGVIAVTWSVWFVTWFRRRWTASGRLLGRAGRASYAAYVLHPLPLTALMVLLAPLPVPVPLKFVLVAVVAVPLCFTLGYGLTRLPVLSRVL